MRTIPRVVGPPIKVIIYIDMLTVMALSVEGKYAIKLLAQNKYNGENVLLAYQSKVSKSFLSLNVWHHAVSRTISTR